MRAALLLLAAAASACVYYPRAEYQDADCRTITRKLHLDSAEFLDFNCSSGDPRACIAALAGAGLISAGTAVISGSIVAVNNSVSWIEEKGRCSGKTSPPATPPATASPSADEKCRMIARKLRFDSAGELDSRCASRDPRSCLSSLAAAGFVHGSTVAAPGSIVIVHDTVSWLEPRGSCDAR